MLSASKRAPSPLQEYRARAANSIPAGDAEEWRTAGTVGNGPRALEPSGEGLDSQVVVDPAGRPGSEPRARPGPGRREMGHRGGELSCPRLCGVRGPVDDPWRAATDPREPAGQQGGGSPGERRPRSRPSMPSRRRRRSRRRPIPRRFGATACHESAIPVNWGWGAGPSYWPSPSRDLQ